MTSKRTDRERSGRIRISALYRGVTGIERYCREECSRTGPASVWRVYAFMWSRDSQAFTSERDIQQGTRLSEQAAADAIYLLWEQGVLEIED